eukprot:TRINITY_DN783_c0_g1_i1.p2 TRINITY_DN783_c0_g1~~TRINITY_DN783_c0_g1_i1.p2  ORF type:complete len:53 (+),score=10.87 TRINITY_DN783_c0_g1_i1:184-342(+)
MLKIPLIFICINCVVFRIILLQPKFLKYFIHFPHVLCVDTGRSSETAKAHRG